MNRIEKVVYDCLKFNPKIKLFVRNVYQTIFDLFPRKANFTLVDVIVKEGYFYGFHDTSPFSFDNHRVLSNKVNIPLRMPKRGEFIPVGYFDFDGNHLGDYHQLGVSYAWNYHKGCRLQWMNKDHFIYNTYIDKRICSVIVDVTTGCSKILNYPIDTVSPDGKYATSFSYERLELLMPGYGYPYSDTYSYCEERYPSETGLYIIDLKTEERRMLLSLSQLHDELEGYENKSECMHYVTHTEFSGSGRYISFMHRWVGKEKRLRWTRLLIYDLETGQYFALPTNGMVSHYVWRNNNLLAYCRIGEVDSHVIFDIENGGYKHILTKELNSDGHQTYVSDDKFVTDTYPDRRRVAKLYLVDITKNSHLLLASIYHPKKYQSTLYCHKCCDFHPCASSDGKYVCFDAIVNDVRSLCILPLNNL